MKKIFFVLAALSLSLISGPTAQAADKVVVIPLNSSKQAVSFEKVSRQYTIAGTTFQMLRGYGMTEANGYEVTHSQPFGMALLLNKVIGIGHNKDAVKMTFTAPVHLPQGASLGGIGAAVCSTDDTISDHNITLELVKTDVQDGTRTTIRSLSITDSNCGTLQAYPPNTLYLYEGIDNTQYAYEFNIKGIEGGTCNTTTSGSPPLPYWSCDDRRTIIQFAAISYWIDEIVK